MLSPPDSEAARRCYKEWLAEVDAWLAPLTTRRFAIEGARGNTLGPAVSFEDVLRAHSAGQPRTEDIADHLRRNAHIGIAFGLSKAMTTCQETAGELVVRELRDVYRGVENYLQELKLRARADVILRAVVAADSPPQLQVAAISATTQSICDHAFPVFLGKDYGLGNFLEIFRDSPIPVRETAAVAAVLGETLCTINVALSILAQLSEAAIVMFMLDDMDVASDILERVVLRVRQDLGPSISSAPRGKTMFLIAMDRFLRFLAGARYGRGVRSLGPYDADTFRDAFHAHLSYRPLPSRRVDSIWRKYRANGMNGFLGARAAATFLTKLAAIVLEDDEDFMVFIHEMNAHMSPPPDDVLRRATTTELHALNSLFSIGKHFVSRRLP